MTYCSQFPVSLSSELSSCLSSLGHFIYLPNPGNAGDSLIAVASMLVFEQMGLSYELYDENKDYSSDHTLVYGGGGSLIPDWGFIPRFQQLFSAPGLKRCVVLPQSMRSCQELLEIMDERFTVFLRERQAYDYALSLNNKAQFILTSDMVFHLDPAAFSAALRKRNFPPSYLAYRWAGLRRKFLKCADENNARTLSNYRFYRNMRKHIGRGLPQSLQKLPDGRTVSWMLRTDKEKATSLTAQAVSTFDLSLIHNSECMDRDENLITALLFLEAINAADIIITDRLHISIGAALLNKQLIMLDNSYGKLSGVWELSMKHMPHVRFCRSDEELAATLRQI